MGSNAAVDEACPLPSARGLCVGTVLDVQGLSITLLHTRGHLPTPSLRSTYLALAVYLR